MDSNGVVVFDPDAFVLRYPSFAAYNAAHPGMLQMFFDEATLLLANDYRSKVCDLNERRMLLNMLTAHIAQLAGVLSAGGAGSTATQVGRVSSATEGSVSASLDNGTVYASAAWYQQTQYGSQYWAMTAKYRNARFVMAARNRRC